MKKCTKCDTQLCHTNAYFNKRINNFDSVCKQCQKTASALRYINNPQRKEQIKQYYKWREKNDANFRLSQLLRARLRRALNSQYKAGSAVKDLGCSIQEFKLYLESKFQPGMTWEERQLWHIDHIKPLSSFDLTNKEQLAEACHYTNLQPLWASDNLKKGAR